MSYPVKGEDAVLELYVVDTYYPVLCATDCTFNREVEFIPISGPESIAREFMPRREEWTMSVTGITKLDNDAALTFFYLLQNSVRRELHTVRITFTDEAGTSKQISGSVYIGSQSINGNINDYATGTIEFRGTGQFTVDTTQEPVPPEVAIYADYWIPVNGRTYVSGASTGYTDGTTYTLTATDEILEVWVENQAYYAVTGTPTNGSPEYNFDTGTLRVNLPAAMVLDGTMKVFIMFKRTT